MKARILLIIGIIIIGMIFFSLFYIPAYLKCQSFEGDLTSLDTCVLRETKWMACYDFDPVNKACIIDGMKIKDPKK